MDKDRVTKKDKYGGRDGIWVTDEGGFQTFFDYQDEGWAAVKRCAEYEESGLTPDIIKMYTREIKMLIHSVEEQFADNPKDAEKILKNFLNDLKALNEFWIETEVEENENGK